MQDNKGYMGGLVKYNIIGSGSFADIYTCDYLDLLYAYKEFRSEEYVKNISSNIIKLSEYYDDTDFVFPYKFIYKNPSDSYFKGYIMDCLYKYESLFKINSLDIQYKDKIELLKKVRELLDKMHNEYNILHCDLTSKNILYNIKDKIVKINDFDSCIDLKSSNKTLVSSPNLLALEYANAVGIDKDLDMYMFNLVTFALLNNVPYYFALGMIRDNKYGIIEDNNVIKIFDGYKDLDTKTLKKEYAIDYIK